MPYVHSSYYVWYDLIVSTCDIGWWTWIINISYLKSVQCVVLTCWSSPSPVTVSDCTELGELQVAPLCLSLAPLRCKQLSADTATPGGSYLLSSTEWTLNKETVNIDNSYIFTTRQFTMEKPPMRCPQCQADVLVRIVYGKPGPDLQRAALEGKVILGGCAPDRHNWGCKSCQATFIFQQ